MYQSISRIIYSTALLIALTPIVEASSIKGIEQLDLKQYTGKVVYLDFWASWCKPCEKSFPWMNSLVTRFPSDSFKIVTINLDSDQKAMKGFLLRVPAQFDIYHDPSGTLAEKFQLRGMPTSYLINKSGEVVLQHIGFQTHETPKYEKEIEELL